MKSNRILSVALSGLFAETQEGGEGQSKAPHPELIAAMPETERNPKGPVGRDWSTLGKEMGQRIIAAEQGLVAATESLNQTKLDVLKEFAKLDEQARLQTRGGIDSIFIGADGANKTKAHQNFLSALGRVHFAVKAEGLEKIMAVLDGEGTLPQKMERLPKQSNSGGHNKGTGLAQIVRDATAAAKEHGAENVVVQPKGPLATPPAPGKGISREAVCAAINLLAESDLEAVATALANRLKKSTDENMQHLGATMIDLLDESAPEVQNAASIAANAG